MPIINSVKTDPNKILPIRYPWAREHYKAGVANNWVPEEVSMQRSLRGKMYLLRAGPFHQFHHVLWVDSATNGHLELSIAPGHDGFDPGNAVHGRGPSTGSEHPIDTQGETLVHDTDRIQGYINCPVECDFTFGRNFLNGSHKRLVQIPTRGQCTGDQG